MEARDKLSHRNYSHTPTLQHLQSTLHIRYATHRQIQTNTDRYRQIQTDTDRYRQIQTDTDRYRQIQTDTDRYRHPVPPFGRSETP